jgi:hypothetical protein
MKNRAPEGHAAIADDEWNTDSENPVKLVPATSDSSGPVEPAGRERRITEEFDRAGYVLHQQHLALRALRDGEMGAARAALRALRSTDFEHRDHAEIQLAVLRDSRSEEDDLREAMRRLISLTPRP